LEIGVCHLVAKSHDSDIVRRQHRRRDSQICDEQKYFNNSCHDGLYTFVVATVCVVVIVKISHTITDLTFRTVIKLLDPIVCVVTKGRRLGNSVCGELKMTGVLEEKDRN